MNDNYGINISGGTVSGPMAAGSNAKAVQVNHLAGLIKKHDLPPEARADLAALDEELAQPEPDRTVLKVRLERLASYAVLAESAAALATAIFG
ncbi:hypothetical protein [Herbidospora mongoliensis]|uniref:hypothetical protein n=1 Tax=Herbidospora mongoliensis TaxID=688067 RepID=UPI0008299BEA|nr:hypothetical protein [Herbidospora mongoliensis]